MSTNDSTSGANKPRQQAPVMRKKEFLDQVMASVTTNRREAKAVIEATLLALSEALQEGKTLAVAPLGKARVARVAGTRGDETYVVRFKPKKENQGEGAAAGSASQPSAKGATVKRRVAVPGAKAAPKAAPAGVSKRAKSTAD